MPPKKQGPSPIFAQNSPKLPRSDDVFEYVDMRQSHRLGRNAPQAPGTMSGSVVQLRRPGPPLTLADVLAELQQRAELSAERKQHLSYRIEYFCATVGQVPRQIPIDLDRLRFLGAGMDPVVLKKKWDTIYNILWAVTYVLQTSSLVATHGRVSQQLTPEWQQVLEATESVREHTYLSRLACFCTAMGIAPAAVDDNTMVAFVAERQRTSLLPDRAKPCRRTVPIWNALRERAPDLTLQALSAGRLS